MSVVGQEQVIVGVTHGQVGLIEQAVRNEKSAESVAGQSGERPELGPLVELAVLVDNLTLLEAQAAVGVGAGDFHKGLIEIVRLEIC